MPGWLSIISYPMPARGIIIIIIVKYICIYVYICICVYICARSLVLWFEHCGMTELYHMRGTLEVVL